MKKECESCKGKLKKDFSFCPYCGIILEKRKNQGILGSNDNPEDLKNFFENQKTPTSGNSILNKMLAGAFKMLENEMSTQTEKAEPEMKSNFKLFINGRRINMPVQKIEKKENKLPAISEETLERSINLPRKEAKSRLVRLKNKVLYELETPGLRTVNDVLINKLEEAIEVKAFADKAVYYKTLPIRLNLLQLSITPEGKLILEFRA